MTEPDKHDALNAPSPASGDEESGAGYGNDAGPQTESEAAEEAGSDQR